MLSPLVLKAAIFSALLLLAGSHWWWVILFIPASFYFYFRPSLNSGQFILSFLVLLITSLFFINSSLITHYPLLITLFFGFLFFLLLGVKNLIFVKRQLFYDVFESLLFLTIFTSFFRAENASLFFGKYLLVFFAVAFLLKEFLIFSTEDFRNSSKKNLIVYGTAFLILQLVWAIALLPLGFLNAASLVLLITLILQDFIVHHFSGTINRSIVLRNATVFLILSLVILGASRWQP